MSHRVFPELGYINSDEEEDEYVPFGPFDDDLTIVSHSSHEKEQGCIIWSENFTSEKSLQEHVSISHPETAELYHYHLKKRCRICNGVFPSLSLRGLMSHVIERKCDNRKERKLCFIKALDLIPVMTRDEKTVDDLEVPIIVSVSSMATDYNAVSESMKDQCTSFHCRSANPKILFPCKTCLKSDIGRTKPIVSLQPLSNETSALKPCTNGQEIRSRRKSQHQQFAEKSTLEEYLPLIANSRQSAVQANLKNCKRITRKVKREERRLLKHQDSMPQDENSGVGQEKIILKVQKYFWDQCKSQEWEEINY